MELKFLGACRQITGSRYLFSHNGIKILIDCGLFQERKYLEKNWDAFSFPPDRIDFILLTHIHLDHSGLLPKIVREGYHNPILTTSATRDMIDTVLLDSARIHEEDAAYKKKRHRREKRKGPYPEIPLYTVSDAEKVFPLVKSFPYNQPVNLNHGLSVKFHDAGHILGSAMLEITAKEKNGRSRKIIFSGDIGQNNKPLIRDPSVFHEANYVVMESTYGDRMHENPENIEPMLSKIINETVRRGGNIVIPIFVIERAQELLFHLSRLVHKKKIPRLMIFLDSPMAVDITEVFLRHKECLDRQTLDMINRGERPFDFPGLRFVRSADESKTINRMRGSCIIMAGSGMCTGGRIKHHLVHNISRPESTILFVGYQASGTLGRQIVDGSAQVRIHGKLRPVKARIDHIDGFSAHADRKALIEWIIQLQRDPEGVFITHGEEKPALSLARKIREKTGWSVEVPRLLENKIL